MVLGLVSLGALLSIPARAQAWEKKDWTQWTIQDCKFILLGSPWAVKGSEEVPNKHIDSSGEIVYDSFLPTAQMSSSLVIRQALVREAQLLQRYDKMSLQKRKAFDQKAATCLGNTYDDRFIIQIVFGTIPGPFRLYVDGRRIEARELRQASISPCRNQSGTSIAFPRVVDGKPVIQPGDKELKVGDFTFNIEQMFYKGKLDF